MMKFNIANWKGIHSAEIKLDSVTLISGKNGAGKTSILEAIGAAIHGEPMIYDGITKRAMKDVIHADQKQAGVEVDLGGYKCFLNLPEVTSHAEGEAKPVSKFATGFSDIMELSKRERFRFLNEHFMQPITKEELLKEIKDAEMPDDQFDRLWQTVEDLGWDAAHTQIRDAGAKRKGQWEYITGENYGSIKAENWLPEAWTPDLLNAKMADLQTEYDKLKKAFHLQEAGVLDDNERAKLETLAKERKKYYKTLDELNEKYSFVSEQILDMVEAQYAQRQTIDLQEKTMECPECKTALLYIPGDNKLECAKGVGKDAVKAAKGILKELEADKNKLNEQQVDIDKQRNELKDLIHKADAAKEKLESEAAEFDPDLQANYEKAEERLNSYKVRAEAYSIHQQIQRIAIVVKALSENGLRLKKLALVIKGLNDMFDTMTTGTGWKPVVLDDKMDITYGGRPYSLLSQSEQLRVKIMFQLLLTYRDKSAIMCVDRADVLDRDGRNGLLTLIKRENIPTIIAMTLNSEEECPVFKSLDGWRTYWITDEHIAKEVKK